MIAAYNGYCDIVKMLLDKDSKLCVDIKHLLRRTNSGFNIIACVAQFDRLDILKIVHKHMEDVMDKEEIELLVNVKEDLYG